jgi:hypothetical protein
MSDDEKPARIIVCQGPPRCDLRGKDAVAAQAAGCPFCRVLQVTERDDLITISKPGEA